MFIPYSTDAPVYYWPFATVGLIVVNVALFAAIVFGQVMPIEDWMLWYGDGLHPLQWCMSIFMHGSIEHLVMLRAPEAEPGSLGASAAIFGLIAIAAIWAPKNEVTCFWLFGFRAG